MPVRYAGNDNRITYGKTPIKSIMQGEVAVYGVEFQTEYMEKMFLLEDDGDYIRITGLTDYAKTQKNIVVFPNYNNKPIKYINPGAFRGCALLESIVIPFVGGSADKTEDDTWQYPFGYIFGTSSYTGATEIIQYFYGSDLSHTTEKTYYIPSSLRNVTIIGDKILNGAFWGCAMLTSVTIGKDTKSIKGSAFDGCTGLESVYYLSDIANWVSVDFGGITSNPLSYADNLYINNEIVTDIIIPNTVSRIKEYAFFDYNKLTSITIPTSIIAIEREAFFSCDGLVSVSYQGTVSQWGEINKGNNWNGDCPFTAVVCSDGTVSV